MAQIILHSDINMDFIPHPLTGNINSKVNIDAIRQSIKNLFLLDAFDIPFEMDIHVNMKRYLFEPITRSHCV